MKDLTVTIGDVEYVPKSHVKAEKGESLGPLLRRLRKSIGYTLDEAAARIQTSKSYVWELENGRSEPSLRVAQAIAEVYQVDVGMLAASLPKI